MSFVSPFYLVFLPLVVLCFYRVPHRARWGVLLAASAYAYLSWNPWLLLLLLAMIAVTYLAARAMPGARTVLQRRLLLGVCLVFCLGALVFFKYAAFLTDNLFALLRLARPGLTAPELNILLPVGISFYTFQTLSYVIDVYRGTLPPERHFGYYALFVIYFPQLVAGPIERPQDLLPQLKRPQPFCADNLRQGLAFLVSGYFRKCVAADYFGLFVDRIYGSPDTANALSIAVAALLFMGQIYNDFAGYSEIAIGTARLMGIRLTRNFDCPLASGSIREFMRRWHITLNTWFRDYLYIPLGGSRRGPLRHIRNVLIVYALCGLWHGANWTYLLWGVTIGVVVILEGLLRAALGRPLPRTVPFLVLRRVWVLAVCAVAAIIFRSPSVTGAGLLFRRFFATLGQSGLVSAATEGLGITGMDVVCLALILAVLSVLDDLTATAGGIVTLHRSLRRVALFCCLTMAILLSWLAAYGTGSASAFVYFQF